MKMTREITMKNILFAVVLAFCGSVTSCVSYSNKVYNEITSTYGRYLRSPDKPVDRSSYYGYGPYINKKAVDIRSYSYVGMHRESAWLSKAIVYVVYKNEYQITSILKRQIGTLREQGVLYSEQFPTKYRFADYSEIYEWGQYYYQTVEEQKHAIKPKNIPNTDLLYLTLYPSGDSDTYRIGFTKKGESSEHVKEISYLLARDGSDMENQVAGSQMKKPTTASERRAQERLLQQVQGEQEARLAQSKSSAQSMELKSSAQQPKIAPRNGFPLFVGFGMNPVAEFNNVKTAIETLLIQYKKDYARFEYYQRAADNTRSELLNTQKEFYAKYGDPSEVYSKAIMGALNDSIKSFKQKNYYNQSSSTQFAGGFSSGGTVPTLQSNSWDFGSSPETDHKDSEIEDKNQVIRDYLASQADVMDWGEHKYTPIVRPQSHPNGTPMVVTPGNVNSTSTQVAPD